MTGRQLHRPVPGSLLFARYAYPPNALGYCGPPDSDALREYTHTGVTDRELTRLARSFDGAWPYLTLIAERSGIGDPLDRRVVEAYWLGSPLLDRVGLAGLADASAEHVRPQFRGLAPDLLDNGAPHHSFHVLCMYPWVRLLAAGAMADHALRVLDQCRIRWGQVTDVSGDRVAVRSRPLSWDGHRLALGTPVTRLAEASAVSGTELAVGDRVSLHWDWICDRLSERQVRAVRGYTARHLALVNRTLRRGGPPGAPDGPDTSVRSVASRRQ